MEKDYTVQMEDSTLSLNDKNKRIIAKVHMSKNQMFSINIKIEIERCYQANLKEESRLWHLRYGHLNYESLKLLSSKGMVNGLPIIKHPKEVCEGCIVGKQTRIPFPSSKAKHASAPLNLVRTDLCGSFFESPRDNKYFISFIDDYTRKVYIYFLKKKSTAFSTFKIYKNVAERESGNRIKILRSDKGEEYTSNEFKRYCSIEGIQ